MNIKIGFVCTKIIINSLARDVLIQCEALGRAAQVCSKLVVTEFDLGCSFATNSIPLEYQKLSKRQNETKDVNA